MCITWDSVRSLDGSITLVPLLLKGHPKGQNLTGASDLLLQLSPRADIPESRSLLQCLHLSIALSKGVGGGSCLNFSGKRSFSEVFVSLEESFKSLLSISTITTILMSQNSGKFVLVKLRSYTNIEAARC